SLWRADLGSDEFALVTATVIQAKGPSDSGKVKDFRDQKSEAEKKVAERSKPKLSQGEFDTLHDELLKAQRKVVLGIKKFLPRDPNTDHYGGMFDILIWNDNGTLKKRLDPLGLTFGEHYGVDPKIYTK